MTRSIARASFLSLALLAAGCGRLVAETATTGLPRAAHGGHVTISMESEPVPAGFTEIALVRARGEGNRANLEDVLEALKDEARQVGASAIVRVRIDQGSAGLSAIGVAGVM